MARSFLKHRISISKNTRRMPRRLSLSSATALLLALAGCAHNDRIPAQGPDPFLGGPQGGARDTAANPAVPRPGETPAAAAAGPASNTKPPAVAASAASNPRTGGGATLMPPDSLSSGPASLALANGQSRARPADTNGGPLATRTSVQQTQWNNSAGGLTWEQARDRLQQLRPVWVRLEYQNGEWWFSCEVPSPANPQALRRYEHHDPADLNAVRAVLDQIERESRR